MPKINVTTPFRAQLEPGQKAREFTVGENELTEEELQNWFIQACLANGRAELVEDKKPQEGSQKKSAPEALATEALAAMEPSAIAALPLEQVKLLSSDQVASMTGDQVAALTPEQLAVFSAEQLAALTDEQLTALNEEQLAALKALAKGESKPKGKDK